MSHLEMIQRETKGKIRLMDVPSKEQASHIRQQRLAEELVSIIEKKEYEGLESTASELLEQHDPVTVVAAALASLQNETKEPMKTLTGERPVVQKKRGKPAPSKGKGGGRFNGPRGSGQKNRAAVVAASEEVAVAIAANLNVEAEDIVNHYTLRAYCRF